MYLVDMDNQVIFTLRGRTDEGKELVGIMLPVDSIDKLNKVDPVYAAHGCYCSKCEFLKIPRPALGNNYCTFWKHDVDADGFCYHGSPRKAEEMTK